MAYSLHSLECTPEPESMTLKIERISGKRRTRIRLSGAFRSEHLDQMKAEIERGGPRVALDWRRWISWMSKAFAFSILVRRMASQCCTVRLISGSGCPGNEAGQKHGPINVRRNRLLWRMKMASMYRTVEASAPGGLAAPSALQEVMGTKEASLLATAKSGETAALDTLYRAHAEKLFRTVHRITRNREDAEDAVQDSLLRAFLHLKSFAGRSTFSTWLTRIGINSALMILRKKRNSRAISAHGPGADETVWEVPDSTPGSPAWITLRSLLTLRPKAH